MTQWVSNSAKIYLNEKDFGFMGTLKHEVHEILLILILWINALVIIETKLCILLMQ